MLHPRDTYTAAWWSYRLSIKTVTSDVRGTLKTGHVSVCSFEKDLRCCRVETDIWQESRDIKI